MQIQLLARPRSGHQSITAKRLREGFKAHGLTAEIREPQEYSPCDLAVTWGHRQDHVYLGQKTRGSRYLVMERAYLGDRHHWTSLGYDGLNGYADFCNAEVPGDRAWPHLHHLLPWKYGGDYALVMGQCPGDASLQGMDISQWAQQTCDDLAKRYDRVVYRPHPLRPTTIQRVEHHRGDLAEALAGAAVVATFNSNSGVDAVLAGVPTITTDPGSMAWDVTTHDTEADPVRPDRQRWLERLSYCQWLPEELEDGTAWDHLKGGLSL